MLYDSWTEYYNALENPRAIDDSRGAYLPSPDDVERRAADLRWLQEHEFCESFITRVMLHANRPRAFETSRRIEDAGKHAPSKSQEARTAGIDLANLESPPQ